MQTLFEASKNLSEIKDINSKDEKGQTLLHRLVGGCYIAGGTLYASECKMSEVERLLAAGADVNSKDNTGSTPLHEAVFLWRFDVVDCLIKHGADDLAKSNNQATPWGMATSFGRGHRRLATEAMLKAVEARDLARSDEEKNKALPSTGDDVPFPKEWTVSDLERRLAEGEDVNAKDELGRTLLHKAVLSLRFDAIGCLIKHSADVHAKDRDGETAWLIAARFGGNVRRELIETMLKAVQFMEEEERCYPYLKKKTPSI